MTVRIRIESVFDVGLARLLSENFEDLEIVSPSKTVSDMIDAPKSLKPHDIHISDLDKRSGIKLKGEADLVAKIQDMVKENLLDSIVFSHDIHLDSVYLAEVLKYNYRKKFAILDLGADNKAIMFNVSVHVGDTILVQVKDLSLESDKLPVCSPVITISGKYVVVEEGANFVRVSKKIRGEARKRLHEIGKQIVPENFGVIIRTSAQDVAVDEIEDEIKKLVEMWASIEEQANELDNPGLLVSGEVMCDIFLGYQSKQSLDNLRSDLMPTVPNYHLYKAYSMAAGFALDYTQNFIEQLSISSLKTTMEGMILERDYPLKNHIKAEFNYLNGSQEEVIIGDIFENQEIMKTKSILFADESYPNFTLQESDIVEISFAPGSWTMHYKYYTPDHNHLKGERLRILTPIDLSYRGRIRTYDMGISLYKNDQGETAIVNTDNSNLIEKGMISTELDNQLGDILRLAMEKLDQSENEIIIKT